MENTITKGTGNSRSIKSVPNLLTLYPTWEAAAQAMIDGTFPIDLGPLNPAGVQTMGTELNKANLLSDETAALYPGLPENPVPDDVLAKIWQYLSQISGKAVVAAGKYTGTGTPSQKINVGFTPKAVFVIDGGYNTFFISGSKSNVYRGGLAVSGGPISISVFDYESGVRVPLNVLVIESGGFTVFSEDILVDNYGNYVHSYTNLKNALFHYFAIG